jgi:hypothetical protein
MATQAGVAADLARGRLTNSPPQFGQICRSFDAQAAQNVHSNEQINARSAAEIGPPHISQPAFISSAIFGLALLAILYAGKLACFV